jgi:hypothetical protein
VIYDPGRGGGGGGGGRGGGGGILGAMGAAVKGQQQRQLGKKKKKRICSYFAFGENKEGRHRGELIVAVVHCCSSAPLAYYYSAHFFRQ